MGVGRRAAIYAAAGAILILISGFASATLAIAMLVLVNALLLLLYAADCAVTPSMKDFEASRELELTMSLSAESTVVITVKNRSDKTVKVRIKDDVPEFFEFTDTSNKAFTLPARSYCTAEYTVKPLKRGAYVFPSINVKVYGLLGLCTKQRSFKTDTEYRVYPNMKEIEKYRLSSISKNMFRSGVKRVRTVANGGEFNSLREYNTDDPYNAINWAATSRRGQLVVNTYTPERNQYVYVMMDSSRVMNSEIDRIKKLDYSINACFLLADYCIRGGDNIGLSVFDHKVERFVAAGKGNSQMELLADSLYDVETNETSANYDNAFIAFNQAVKRRALVFIFTELFNADEAARFVESVKKHMGKHIVYTVTINDPRKALLAAGEPESEQDIFVRAAAIKFNEDRRKIKAILGNAGILNSDVPPDKLSPSVVASYLDVKHSGLL